MSHTDYYNDVGVTNYQLDSGQDNAYMAQQELEDEDNNSAFYDDDKLLHSSALVTATPCVVLEVQPSKPQLLGPIFVM